MTLSYIKPVALRDLLKSSYQFQLCVVYHLGKYISFAHPPTVDVRTLISQMDSTRYGECGIWNHLLSLNGFPLAMSELTTGGANADLTEKLERIPVGGLEMWLSRVQDVYEKLEHGEELDDEFRLSLNSLTDGLGGSLGELYGA